MRRLSAITFVVAVSWSTVAHSQAPAAEALFDQGREALKRGDLDTACARFRASEQLDPAPGTRLNLGDCEERRGKIASAWAAFRGALEKLPPGDSRIAVAQARIQDLERRLPRVTLTLAPGAPKDTTVREGENTIGSAATFGVPLPFDPGVHHLTVLAPGRPPKSLDVTIVEGKATTIAVAPAPVEQAPNTPDPQAGTSPAPPGPDKVEPPSLTHAGQFGAVLRADIDGMRAGVVAAPGLSFGIGSHFEVSTTALVGKNKGLEPGATVYFLKGAWKPLLAVGVPIFFIDGARPGVHAAAGVQWDPIRHFGVFAALGVAAFPSMPDGFNKVVFVPSVGVQPRL